MAWGPSVSARHEDPAVSTLEALRRGDLSGAREIRLPGLSEFPTELLGLADTLELLDIGGGSLTTLPHDFSRFRNLRIRTFDP